MALYSVQITVVYKFGGSSVADAACMRQAAEIICAFPDQLPCVVMSAMGKTTNLLLEAGKHSIEKGTKNIPSLKALRQIKELHRDTCSLLALGSETVADVECLLTELQQLLTGMSIMQVYFTPTQTWCNVPRSHITACTSGHVYVKAHALCNCGRTETTCCRR